MAGEPDAAVEIVEYFGNLPLTMRIAASRLAARRSWRVRTMRDRLAEASRRLDELKADDLQVRASFRRSYDMLPAEQARAFWLASIPDGERVSLTAAAALVDLPEPQTEDLAEALVDEHLLSSPWPREYRYHRLLRLFAREEFAKAATALVEPALRRFLAAAIRTGDQGAEIVARRHLARLTAA